MIRYALVCGDGHDFEAWFADSDSFTEQQKAGQVSCSVCGSAQVGKALMTPAVTTGRKRKPVQAGGGDGETLRVEKDTPPARDGPPSGEPEAVPVAANSGKREEVLAALRKLRKHVTDNADYVGARFPEEARRIHYGEAESRGIYGEASPQEARALAEEGVDFHPLPVLPEDRN